MKDFKKIVQDLDEKTDKISRKTTKLFRKIFPIFSITLLLSLLVFFIFRVYKNKPYFVTSIISNDVLLIVDSLNKIDEKCNILSIENEHNYVDFLNVIKFTGSEVGCLNLAFPENWSGPYLEDNPTMQGKLYEIVKTKEGIFVIPGQGVILPNGLSVGKDFEINFNSSINKMLQNGGELNYKGRALAAKLEFEIGDWGREKLRNKKIQSLNDSLKEFNEAMSFAKKEDCEINESLGNKFIF